MEISPILKCYPGKAAQNGSVWLPLWIHNMDTAEIMTQLLDLWIPKHLEMLCTLPVTEYERLCRFLALIHDIGKLTPVFAARILEHLPEIRDRLAGQGLRTDTLKSFVSAGQSPHAKAGEAILLNLNCPPGIAAVVGAHHGRPQELSLSCKDDPGIHMQNYFGSDELRPIWEKLRCEWFYFALHEAGYSDVAELPIIPQHVQFLLSGLLIMADWLASNTDYFPLIPLDSCGSYSQYPNRTISAWSKLCLPVIWKPMSYVMDAYRFETVFGFSPNEVQSMMIQAANEAQNGGGIFILEAQMGVGKTEAALAAAEVLASKNGCGGVFFGLPTQATANGLFERLVEWAKTQAEETQQSIRLAHGMAELNENYRSIFRGHSNGNEDGELEEQLIVHPWFNGRKQALLADFVIGTVDQLLMASLKQRHVMLRHLGLAGKIVIVDECHAYDAYMNQYLDRTLSWLGKYEIPVIILSATLPEQRRAELVASYLNDTQIDRAEWCTNRDYPLLTWTIGREVRQTSVISDAGNRSVKILNLHSSDWLSLLWSNVLVGGCCGVIVNTVHMAQELAQIAKEKIPEAEVLLLHSRFSASDRAGIEAKLLKRIGKHSSPKDRAGLIVIGTQVLEQSLDIDFDVLITQLCPMDLLLQRLGRLHRHNRSRPESLSQAYCYILDMDKEYDGGSRAVYGDWLLLRTKALLPETVYLPQSIPQLVQDTYRSPDENLLQEEVLRAAWEAYVKTRRDKETKADHYRLSAPQKSDARRIRTIDGLLNTSYPADGIRAEAAVRDGEASIAVLVMLEQTDGRISFFPWQHISGSISATHAPDDETARKIARQRLTLPMLFSAYGREEKTIRALEALNSRKLSEWQNSGWLNGELILLFDENLCADLCGQHLRYTEEYGLIVERTGDEFDPTV